MADIVAVSFLKRKQESHGFQFRLTGSGNTCHLFIIIILSNSKFSPDTESRPMEKMNIHEPETGFQRI